MADAPSPETTAEIKRQFRKFDADNDGCISREELGQIFHAEGGWTEEELDQLFKGADVNGDGAIDYDEFVDWLMGENKDAPSDPVKLPHAAAEAAGGTSGGYAAAPAATAVAATAPAATAGASAAPEAVASSASCLVLFDKLSSHAVISAAFRPGGVDILGTTETLEAPYAGSKKVAIVIDAGLPWLFQETLMPTVSGSPLASYRSATWVVLLPGNDSTTECFGPLASTGLVAAAVASMEGGDDIRFVHRDCFLCASSSQLEAILSAILADGVAVCPASRQDALAAYMIGWRDNYWKDRASHFLFTNVDERAVSEGADKVIGLLQKGKASADDKIGPLQQLAVSKLIAKSCPLTLPVAESSYALGSLRGYESSNTETCDAGKLSSVGPGPVWLHASVAGARSGLVQALKTLSQRSGPEPLSSAVGVVIVAEKLEDFTDLTTAIHACIAKATLCVLALDSDMPSLRRLFSSGLSLRMLCHYMLPVQTAKFITLMGSEPRSLGENLESRSFLFCSLLCGESAGSLNDEACERLVMKHADGSDIHRVRVPGEGVTVISPINLICKVISQCIAADEFTDTEHAEIETYCKSLKAYMVSAVPVAPNVVGTAEVAAPVEVPPPVQATPPVVEAAASPEKAAPPVETEEELESF